MKNNIILIGMMGCGKTTVGREISKISGLGFIDLDIEIELQQNMKIPEIFSKFGEGYFRELENKFLKKDYENLVISTGGGIIENPENIELLKKLGKVFYIELPPKTLYERIKGDKNRPLLADWEKFYALFNRREKLYKNAATPIDGTKSPEEIAKEIYGNCC